MDISLFHEIDFVCGCFDMDRGMLQFRKTKFEEV